jgi:hypothetical protein
LVSPLLVKISPPIAKLGNEWWRYLFLVEIHMLQSMMSPSNFANFEHEIYLVEFVEIVEV